MLFYISGLNKDNKMLPNCIDFGEIKGRDKLAAICFTVDHMNHIVFIKVYIQQTLIVKYIF